MRTFNTGDEVLFIADCIFNGVQLKGLVGIVAGPAPIKFSEFQYVVTFTINYKTNNKLTVPVGRNEIVKYEKDGLATALYL